MRKSGDKNWFSVGGFDCDELGSSIKSRLADTVTEGVMPKDEVERVANLSTSISSGSFVVSPKRLELLRGLCHLYSAGIRAEKITSHRRVLGPVIVAFKQALFRVLSVLLGPSFQFQRDFNAGVIRLLSDLCNEDSQVDGRKL